ncbi:hypothetical protein P618_200635 [Holospora obtusa F1]|uniref:Uncharacterized protein n=1 Tax=Holospora obtusa F1 TaxID=1399147 RepID=W6TEI3_HOLOB|nr:hypothetical protein [Holospora obtusa]ETZ07179.1 hypothetical protein P618_200635 [Holospora obtusa F1]
MQEKMTKDSPESESIDDILESIKGLVYPVIDLNRPLKEDNPDCSIQHGRAPNVEENAGNQENQDHQKSSTSAAQAIFSFIHSVRRDKQEESHLPEVKKEEKQGTSLESFLTGVIQDALNPHIRSVLEQEMKNFLSTDGKNLMEALIVQWFDVHGKGVVRDWLEKYAPTLVVRCVEVYLQELSKIA